MTPSVETVQYRRGGCRGRRIGVNLGRRSLVIDAKNLFRQPEPAHFATTLKLPTVPNRRESQYQGPMPEALMAQLQVLRLLRISTVRGGVARSNTRPASCIFWFSS